MSLRHFLLLALAAAVISSALGVVWARHEHRQAYIALTTLEKQRDELNIEFGRLQLEQATWSEANRIEQVAGTRLGMTFPSDDDIVVLKP
ncbi:MAG: cell division protein FtsL [Arenimonas sp. SCN 70-307]|uniref:cell division protein FtsL n=1 Tax=Arenimonas sp. SCN 70-307 TaxID=1660089 RepID=UPI000868EC3A|nr:cell division protein FtsL [Arenimonas sp. SCN 70-307]ODS63112.1 MAG: cell division protein FtsL [Arenimonas sp. SCN 70-307]